MLDHAHFWPLVSEKCWSEGRWWPIRGSWWWIITNRRCRWHFTLFCDEEESPSTRWSNRLNKGALKATVSLEEPVDLPRSRRLTQEAAGSLKTVKNSRLSIEDLNPLRLHTVSVLHIASLWRWLSMSLTVHSALCSGTRGRGFGCRPEEIWDFFAILFFMCVFNFSSVEDHQPHTSCFILTAVTCQGRGCCSAGLFILITGATNPLHTRAVAPPHLMLSPEMQLFPCYASQHKTDFLHHGTEAEVNCVSECEDFFLRCCIWKQMWSIFAYNHIFSVLKIFFLCNVRFFFIKFCLTCFWSLYEIS